MSFFDWKPRTFTAEELPGLAVERDGRYVKTITAAGQALFACSDAEAFLTAVRQAAAQVQFVASAISNGETTLEFTPGELLDLRVAVTLHWARYCLSTGTPIHMEESFLQHPQTWDLVLKTAEKKLGAGVSEAFVLAAHTLNTTVEDLMQWRQVEDDRVANM